MTSIVGAGNREGKFECRRLQSALGCDELTYGNTLLGTDRDIASNRQGSGKLNLV